MRIEIIKPLLLFYFRNKKIKDQGSQIDMSKVKNILLVSNTAIGDTLFATSSIRLIKKHYPDKKIILLIKENFSKLFDNNPNISEVLYFSGKWGQFIKAISILRKKEIDLTFLMNSNEPQATPLAYFAGSKFIIRTPNNNNEFKNMHHNHIFKETLTGTPFILVLSSLNILELMSRTIKCIYIQKIVGISGAGNY